MKKKIIGLFLLVGFQVTAQVSVFDCDVLTRNLSQAELNSDTLFYGTCIEIGGTSIELNNSDNTTVMASEQIHLKSGVHLGGFNHQGKTHLLIEQRSDMDVAVMNYEALNAVLRYKKLELGVPIPLEIENRIMAFIHKIGNDSLWLNPFLEWDIDVEASFYHPESGWYEVIDGFYTREYEQNPNTSDWDDVGTDYPFRIRYAPPQNGLWRSNVMIKIKGQTVYSSGFFNFSVVESGDPGYVHTHENKRNLKRGNRMIFPIGENFSTPDANSAGIAWGGPNSEKYTFIDSVHYIKIGDEDSATYYYGHNLFNSQNTEKAANIVAWNKYHSALEQYLQTPDDGGSKYFRTIQTPYSSLIEFEEKGNYYHRLHYAAETDKILDLCEEYDALFQFNLMIQEPMMKYANYDMWIWDWDHYLNDGTLPDHDTVQWMYNYPVYCYNDDPSYRENGVVYEGSKKPYEMFMDENDLAYHKQRTRYYIARYGYSTKIYSFEILSEPWHLNEIWSSGQSNQGENAPFLNPYHPEHAQTRDAVENYHKVISEYLRDSLKINQLVSMDMAWLTDDDGGLDASILLPSIEMIGFNPYYTSPSALISSYDNNIAHYVEMINFSRGMHGQDKVPIIIPEGGTEPSYEECSNYTQHVVDKMTLPFTGIAGFNAWGGDAPVYQASASSPVTLPSYIHDKWKTTIRTKNHMNGEDVINTLSNTWGGWKHGMQKSKLFIITVHDNVDAIEQQYYMASNKEKVVGYVRNRTYNVHTKRINSDCDLDFGDIEPIDDLENIKWNDIRLPIDRRLSIGNLKTKKEYKIDYYSFKTGNYISTQCTKTSNDGKLQLEYPDLNSSKNPLNPVVWYVIYEESCNSGMQQQNNSDEVEEGLNRTQLLNNKSERIANLNVHPNPFQSQIVIQSFQKDQMVIKSIDGKVVGTYIIDKEITKINTNRLSNGMYLLTFMNQNQTFKLIKQ